MIPRTAGLKRSFILWTASAINSICRLLYGWDANVKVFQKFSKVRFSQDNFIEILDFDYFEIQIIEED